MHGESSLFVRLLAATCVALAGCGGPALLKQAQPIESSRPLAEAKDERILATIETVILPNGAGAWARDAEWDEYLIRIHALSDEPVEIREVAIFDALDHRIESRSDRGDLVDGTRETERRYEQSGKLVRTGGVNDWVVVGLGAAGAGGVAIATAPMVAGGAAVAAVAAPVLIVVGVAYAGASVMRLVNNAEVNSEIKRRATTLPVTVARGTEASVDLFFPITPLSGRTQVVYADRHGEHRLDIDTRQALMELDPPPPTLVSRVDPAFPRKARLAGVEKGYVRARLTLDKQGLVQNVDVVKSIPSHFFDEEAVRTLHRWTYSAGRNEGRIVVVELEFKR